jgi:hypothetical protein
MQTFLFLLKIFTIITIINIHSIVNSIYLKKNIFEKINLNLRVREKNIVKQINGFYGLIGPNVNMENNIHSLYDLFMSDGVIQGIFFENGNLTYVKHLIKTEKVLHEEKFGKISTNNCIMFIFIILNKLKLFPNVLGMANTAILNVKRNDNTFNNYALFERDCPYLLDIDFKKHDIQTVEKINIKSLSHFSGHSKITTSGDIETIDYEIFNKKVNYALLDKNFKVFENVVFKFKYMPIVHDFFSNDDILILIDSPLFFNFEKNFIRNTPVYLDKNKETFIYVYDKKNKQCEEYRYPSGFYTFHYAYVNNDNDKIQIYISQYDELNFENVNIKAAYRMIEINKKTKEITNHKNKELEKYNLDFPICFDNKVISRNFENRRINGFIITKGLKILKKLFFENKNICGEHNIVYIKNTPYLMFFNVEENKQTGTNRNLFSIVNLRTYEVIDIVIHNKLNLGFHSIFLQNSC